eukprot:CAMPEP_0119103228 /NCGR_PEP_ID=MMETSP1180-20130426/1720_1 /TAXON_ID=3052 ORGANISM="Chlamydomonas cf sp, Strain CCMP681" /NCGR_SAMPLE_ID=MMETSP1180 /ASSEMBLY_ACC=CAM_ASM_000741 /LENGTH=388 /DNA_ID=CAMNT_0007087677 /DNA_START=29 /DNA_END=1195 /DNA_ORIENTATION=+
MEAQLASRLGLIAGNPDQKLRADEYRSVLADVIAAASVELCKQFVDHMLLDIVPLVISRALLMTFAAEVGKMPADVHKATAAYALEKLQPRVVSFEDSAIKLREDLASALEREEEWAKAAHTLAGIDLDTGTRNLDPIYKLSKHIKIAMLFLEDDDPVNAEVYIKKASALISLCKDPAQELQYKTCYARVLDAKRRFVDAALRYYELSCAGARVQQIDNDDMENALNQAITCTILAAAGPQRSRMLATIYKDERAERLDVYPFVERVYLERILRREEVEKFAQTLRPHQRATLPDGSTVLQRAVMQHNLLAASKLYNNISLQELGSLLGVTPDKAEGMAADMILEGRLVGLVDQVDGSIRFDDQQEALHLWDTQIQGACNKLNDIISI